MANDKEYYSKSQKNISHERIPDFLLSDTELDFTYNADREKSNSISRQTKHYNISQETPVDYSGYDISRETTVHFNRNNISQESPLHSSTLSTTVNKGNITNLIEHVENLIKKRKEINKNLSINKSVNISSINPPSGFEQSSLMESSDIKSSHINFNELIHSTIAECIPDPNIYSTFQKVTNTMETIRVIIKDDIMKLKNLEKRDRSFKPNQNPDNTSINKRNSIVNESRAAKKNILDNISMVTFNDTTTSYAPKMERSKLNDTRMKKDDSVKIVDEIKTSTRRNQMIDDESAITFDNMTLSHPDDRSTSTKHQHRKTDHKSNISLESDEIFAIFSQLNRTDKLEIKKIIMEKYKYNKIKQREMIDDISSVRFTDISQLTDNDTVNKTLDEKALLKTDAKNSILINKPDGDDWIINVECKRGSDTLDEDNVKKLIHTIDNSSGNNSIKTQRGTENASKSTTAQERKSRTLSTENKARPKSSISQRPRGISTHRPKL